jgi:DNA replication protein DnaC
MKTGSIRDVLNLGFLNRCETLIISGSIHSDMNALARALGMKAEEEGTNVMAVNARALLDEKAEEGDRGKLPAVKLVDVVKSRLLIIENFGTSRLTPSQVKLFVELVTGRINRSSTIITSGHPLKHWASFMAGSAEGKRLFDSLLRDARQIVIGTKSEEAKKRPAPFEITMRAVN